MIIVTFYIIHHVIVGVPPTFGDIALLGIVDILNMFALLFSIAFMTGCKRDSKIAILKAIPKKDKG